MDFLLGLMTGILLLELAILAWFPVPLKNGKPLVSFPPMVREYVILDNHYIQRIQLANGVPYRSARYDRSV